MAKFLTHKINNLFVTSAIAFFLGGVTIINAPTLVFAQIQPSRSPILLTEADNGKLITLKKGDRIQIKLAENPTTGFQWAINTPKNFLSLEKSDYVAASPQLMGSGGERILTFLAQKTGKTSLKLKLWRSWEGEKSVVNRYQINIKINP